MCMNFARKFCSYLLLPPDEETLAQGWTMGSTWPADHSTARRTLQHPQLRAEERWDTEFVLSIKGTP